MEYAIEKPSNKLLAATDLDSDTWVGEVKRIRGKKLPLTAAGVHELRAEYTRTLEPARTLAAETLKLERTLSDLVNQAYALTPGGDCSDVANRPALTKPDRRCIPLRKGEGLGQGNEVLASRRLREWGLKFSQPQRARWLWIIQVSRFADSRAACG
jgi:hypothetical protein